MDTDNLVLLLVKLQRLIHIIKRLVKTIFYHLNICKDAKGVEIHIGLQIIRPWQEWFVEQKWIDLFIIKLIGMWVSPFN